MLPTCLLPTRRPVLSLLAMPEPEFYDLFVGDYERIGFDEPDIQIIDAFNDLVAERAYALMSDWQHREAVIETVSCFAPLAADIPSLDEAILDTSRWLCSNGMRVALRAKGLAYETAELLAARCQEMADEEDESDGDPHANHAYAISEVSRLAETATNHLVFGGVWVTLSLMADRIRVIVDLCNHGEIDMGGHYWDGDEDTDMDPATPPLVTV